MFRRKRRHAGATRCIESSSIAVLMPILTSVNVPSSFVPQLLIDEPTTGLTVQDEAVLMATFREMVNQDRNVVAAMYHVSPSLYYICFVW